MKENNYFNILIKTRVNNLFFNNKFVIMFLAQ